MPPLLPRLCLVTLASALGACAVGPDFHTPAPPASQDWVATPATSTPAAEGTSQQLISTDAAPAYWWRQFGSSQINDWVDQALAHNQTLAQAEAHLRQAQEQLNAETGATQYPQLDLKVGAQRQKIDLAAFGITNVPSPPPFNLYNVSLNVAYTFDLFGANRRQLEALGATVDYQAFELQAARLSVAGNVVTAAIRLAAVRTQIETTQQLLATQERQLQIMQQRLHAGGVAQLDIHNQQSLIAQTRASIPPLQKQAGQMEHQLAVYLGAPPSQLAAADIDLSTLTLPASLPLTVPSSMARQRPDIRAAEALLHQASAQVGVATANLYPQLTLSGSIGSERTGSHDLTNGLNVWNIGLGLMQPLFHGGELQARKRGAEAAWQGATAAYQQTVLTGLQQVADALTALDTDASTLAARNQVKTQNDAILRTTQARYSAGGVSMLQLLDSQRQQQQSALDEIGARADRLADSAALMQALGGGA
ncbi:NodT family efflux transporter outer membrane factor (OMF) lipoprotein [Silvimonas terrae]|uniref:NodT family efflux transporter outer membrane factor (OMF) lipoprotein n=1 Tax=Silvimonas terrae TaxID=300266 RepID=A0A840R8T8_9NEIS|nr:efflux transporter outer membrane subunit [Silvimonas terrae]MBB5189307.1 NodT family efflux transporter outer membrane factor (OMF) lipoprotein [Silvimonas terrae]